MFDRFAIAPAPEVRRLMMTAAARALEDGRTESAIRSAIRTSG